jgi:tRNA (cmo5U34)-methyltransferase
MPRDAIETFSQFADDYEASRRLMIEPYDEFYGAATASLKLAQRPLSRILDLGAGTGVMARFVRAAYPDAEITLLDGSSEMLDKARGTLAGPASFVVADLRDKLPGGEFDAVVSAMAIHHLQHDAQQDLYRRICAALPPGGVFVNAEVLSGAGPHTISAYQRWHHHSVCSRHGTEHDWESYLKRQEADVCAPLASHLDWLTAAGFTEADCIYKQHMYGVLVGLSAI